MRRRPDHRPLATRLAGDGPPGVCIVHPGALPRACWAPLADELAGESVWLLELDAVEEYRDAALGGAAGGLTVEAIAETLCAELARLGATEPLALVGWSFGGVVAYSMAARLPRRPRRVVLLDSIAPIAANSRPSDALGAELLLEWFAMYLGARAETPLEAALQPGATLEDGLERIRTAAIAAGALAPSTPAAGLRKLYGTYVAGLRRNNDLAGPHRPDPQTFTLTLLKAQRSLLAEPDLGWRRLAPVEVLVSPGDHYTMVSRALAFAQLAAVLREPARALPVSANP